MSGVSSSARPGATLTRFFPVGRRFLCRPEDVDRYVFGPMAEMIRTLAREGLISRLDGFMQIVDTETGDTIAEKNFGMGAVYAPVAAAKAVLAAEAGGVGTRMAQLVETGRIRGHHTLHFGSDEGEGIRVSYSGAQAVCDARICMVARALYLMVCDRRALAIAEVRRSLAISGEHLGLVMDIIEEVARRLQFNDLDEVVSYIVDVMTLERAKVVAAQMDRDRVDSDRAAGELGRIVQMCSDGLHEGFDRSALRPGGTEK